MTISKSFFLGIDLGTSGVRISILNKKKEVIYFSAISYPVGIDNCLDWKFCCISLIKEIPINIKNKIVALSIDGTSGTLMCCDYNGVPLGNALPYYLYCREEKLMLKKIFKENYKDIENNKSLEKALRLINKYGKDILLRHQADWMSGWFLNDWRFGEEGNNIRLGWNLIKNSWSFQINNFSWIKSLPEIIPSGKVIGKIASARAKELSLPYELKIVAGTTDSNAAVLATDANSSEGIAVLGSTIVVKCFKNTPIEFSGITNHKINGKWLVGGASNSGCAVLKKFFSDKDLVELSRQIDPETDSGLRLLPLLSQGERFPIDNPYLQPILEPRPISDSLYLHALLEGLSRIEAKCWNRLSMTSSKKPTQIITIGGGAKNPQWRRIRERIIGIPIKTCSRQPAEGVARIALNSIKAITPELIE